MADPANTHSDGVLIWGTQTVSVLAEGASSGGVAFILESNSIDQDTTVLEKKNAFGVVTDDVMIETPYTGSCVLQLAATGTVAPAIASHFTVVPVGGGTPVAFKIKKVGQVFQQDGETKVNIDIRQKFH